MEVTDGNGVYIASNGEFSDAIDANDKDAVQLWAALAKADDQSVLGKLLKSVAPNKLDIKKAKDIKKKLDKK
ncbi:unnamed protein product [Vitrella brassicaformis CCMP3155]|uniref:Uncharacterized protein n=1 Tax=Vitrella brassicaformis (strain CCMP3155) TaxID=1169540 RepID=A0A0G4E8P7_VITBC|nr:unnamed protein product [Vitrella brassicaformis CCMP3155]|eukprot:CEL92225.1 unnamed protein product [Vitrella brassicaformis CCMP3155]